MKYSIYNVVVEIRKYNQFLLYNTFSGSLVEAETDVGILLRSYAQEKTIPTVELEKIGSERVQMLIDNGFLVDDMTDEVAKVKELDSNRFSKLRKTYQRQLSLTLLPSIRCNFDCFYCFEPYHLRQESTVMSTETQDKICKYVQKTLDKPAVESVKTTWYGGEPLLYPEVVENLQASINLIAIEREKEIQSSIITNGFCMTKDISDMLVENKISMAQITLDGPAEIHNKRRLYRKDKNANFETIIRNIKESNPSLRVAIRVNVGSHNQHAIYDLLDELIEYGVWPYRDQTYVYLANVTGEKDAIKREDFLALDDDFRVHQIRRYEGLGGRRKARLEF